MDPSAQQPNYEEVGLSTRQRRSDMLKRDIVQGGSEHTTSPGTPITFSAGEAAALTHSPHLVTCGSRYSPFKLYRLTLPLFAVLVDVQSKTCREISWSHCAAGGGMASKMP